MKSSFGGCGVGGEDVYIGPKQPIILLFFLLSENCESEYMTQGMIISLDE